MGHDARGIARTRLFKLGLALGLLCALAFLFGQGMASLHAAIVATSSAAQAGQAPHALNAPLVNERVTGAIGTPANVANVANAPASPVAFSGAHPHADHAPPKHQRRQRDHTPHAKAAGDESHGGLAHRAHTAHDMETQPLAQPLAQPQPAAAPHDHGQRHDN